MSEKINISNDPKFREFLGAGEVDPLMAAAIRRSEVQAREETLIANAASGVVAEAERITRGEAAAKPQHTESYMELEGFSAELEQGHDMAAARAVLMASGVEVEPVSGNATLRWEGEPPVVVPGPNTPETN